MDKAGGISVRLWELFCKVYWAYGALIGVHQQREASCCVNELLN